MRIEYVIIGVAERYDITDLVVETLQEDKLKLEYVIDKVFVEQTALLILTLKNRLFTKDVVAHVVGALTGALRNMLLRPLPPPLFGFDCVVVVPVVWAPAPPPPLALYRVLLVLLRNFDFLSSVLVAVVGADIVVPVDVVGSNSSFKWFLFFS